MVLETLGIFLEKSPMDRETKLAIIDLVARLPDDDLIRDLMELLRDWQGMDQKGQARFLQELQKIERGYRASKAKISQKSIRGARELADQARREGEISVLREKIIALYGKKRK